MLAAVLKGRGAMSRRIIVLVLVAGALAGTASTGANASSHLPLAPKIIGGGPDPYNHTRWVAALRLSGVPGVDCGGSLYTQRLVVTAAHCTAGTRPWHWTVRLGSKRWDTGGVVRRVTSIYRYPGYRSYADYGDLAVLKLSQPVPIRPVSLVPSGAHYTDPPRQAYIAGWGSLGRYGRGPFPLTRYSTWVWLVPDRNCAGQIPHYNGSVMICAGARGRHTCVGDSGGPLAVWTDRWQLVGVTSYGLSPCASWYGAYAWVGSPPLHRWLGLTAFLAGA
jgi:trypsin